MKIVHIGPFKIGTTNGSYNALWSLACAQAAAGHEVSIIRVGKPVPPEQEKMAKDRGVRFVGFPCHRWLGFWADSSGKFKSLLRELAPDIAHLQYVRVPKYQYISKALVNLGIPYVISLHGGLNSTEMKRKMLRKKMYWHLVEKRVHERASGLHFVSAAEKNDYYSSLSMSRKYDAVVPNVVEIPTDIKAKSRLDLAAAIKIAYLGRYDVWNKGLDLALEMIRALGQSAGIHAELHLYGSTGGRFDGEMAALKEKYSDVSLVDNGFVAGPAKFEALSKCDLYIQYSRFELFGMSLVEAMGMGVPAIVSENCDLAKELAEHDAAIIVPMDPVEAAKTLADNLCKGTDRIARVGDAGRAWATANCNSKSVETAMNNFYKGALGAAGL